MRSLFIFLALFLCATAQAQNVGLPNDAPTLPSNLYTTPSYIGGSVPTASNVSSVTTKVVYATDPQYAGGAKFNRKLFTGNITNGNPTIPTSGSLLYMDGVTVFNPVTAGVKVGDYLICTNGFATGGTPDIVTVAEGTVLSFTSTSITSTSNSAFTFSASTCMTGTDDTAALKAAFAATIAPGSNCPMLVLPSGMAIISASPFINQPANAVCGTNITGQGAPILGNVNLNRDFPTGFSLTNGFDFSTGNGFQAVIGSDNTNYRGILENMGVDALGFPFTSATANKKVFQLGSKFGFNLMVVAFIPQSGTAPHPAFATNSSSGSLMNAAAQADSLAMQVGCGGSTGPVLINTFFGNNLYNLDINNCNNTVIDGAYWDESLGATCNCMVNLVAAKGTRVSNMTALAAAGGFWGVVDGTSELTLTSNSLGTGAFAQQALSIASGGKVIASNTKLFSGNSTTNASVVNNGTFIDNGQVQCSTFTGTANNSGGTVPGSCVANGGNIPQAALTHSVTNFTEGVVNLSASSIGTWTPDQNVNITRIQAINTAGNVTCATPLVLQLSNGTTTQTLTLTSGAASWDTGVIAKQFVSGTAINLTQTAAGACATPPVNLNVSILWQAGSGT